MAQSSNSSATDSIFDAIRAGLKYIERNDDTLEAMLDNTVRNVTTTTTTTALPVSQKESELSFLDILLGDDDDEDEEELSKAQSSWSPTSSTTEKLKEDFLSTIANVRRNEHPIDLRQRYNNSEIGHVSDMRERIAHTTQVVPTSSELIESTSFENTYPASTTFFEKDRSTTFSDVLDTSTYYDTTVWDTSKFDSTTYDTSTLSEYTSTNLIENPSEDLVSTSFLSTLNFDDISTITDSSIEQISKEQTKPQTEDPEEVTSIISKLYSTVTEKDSTAANTEKTPTKQIHSETSTNSFINDLNELLRHNLPVDDMKNASDVKIHKTVEAVHPKLNITTTTENIFSAFLDGISEIFSEKNESFYKLSKNNTNIGNPTGRPTQSKINTLKRLTVPPKLNDTTTTVSISSITVVKTTSMPPTAAPRLPPAVPSSSPFTTQAPLDKPLLFNLNPSILESDLNYDYGEPTLPPSLPNLKIIPFLPADAVQNNRNSEFYKSTGAFPIVTENFKSAYNKKPLEVVAFTLGENEYSKESKTGHGGEFELFGVDDKVPSDAYSRNNEPPEFTSYNSDTTGFPHDQLFHLPSGLNLEYDGYDHTSYPSITENYNQLVDSSYANFGGSSDYHYNAFNIPLDKHIVLPEKYGTVLKYTGQPQQPHYDGTGSIDNSYGIVPSFEKFATIYPENKAYTTLDLSTINPVFEMNNQFSPPSKTEGNLKLNLDDSRLLPSF